MARSMGTKYVLYYRFQGATAHVMKGANGFAAYLLYMLLQESFVHQEGFGQILGRFTLFINRWGDVRTCPAVKMLEILGKLLEMILDVLLIVDGLDECSPEDVTPLLNFLSEQGSRYTTHVAVVARDHVLSEHRIQKVVHISVDPKLVKDDILRFVNQEIKSTPALSQLEESIRSSVREHSQGIFLQARLMIEKLKVCPTIGSQRKSMATFADTFFETYDAFLGSNSANFTAEELASRREIFLIVTGTKADLTPEEVYQFILIDTDTDTINEDARHVQPADEIVRLCQPLLTVGRRNIVRTIHATASEYLLKKQVSREESDLYLARKTLSQLTQAYYREWKTSAALLRRHILSNTKSSSGDEGSFEDKVLYKYAVKHFQEHLTALNNPPEDVIAKLVRFLQGTEFVAWSEVLFELNLGSGLGHKSWFTSNSCRGQPSCPQRQELRSLSKTFSKSPISTCQRF
jgi:hypothetical protein